MIAEWLKQHYGLDVARVRPITSGPGSLAWRIDATDERVFCLKIHRAKTRERVEFEHLLSRQMLNRGFALIPKVVPATKGDTAVLFGEQLMALYEFVPSQPVFDWTLGLWGIEHCALAGIALAEFHHFADVADMGPGLIHGDYHPGNVLFRDGRIVAVLDLDYCREDSRLFDVAYGMTAFAIAIPQARFDEQKAVAFLAGYNEKALSLGLETFDHGDLQPASLTALWLITAWLVERTLLRLYIYHGYSAPEHHLCET